MMAMRRPASPSPSPFFPQTVRCAEQQADGLATMIIIAIDVDQAKVE